MQPLEPGLDPPLPAEGKSVRRAGLVCRFKPFHLGQEAMLRAALARTETLMVGLGSSNAYDVRNPFTAAETQQMIRLTLGPLAERCVFLEIPDLGHGPRWRAMVTERMGDLDLFITANDYVRDLMQSVYPVIHPARLIPRGQWIKVSGTMVRRAMARGDDWASLVPEPVAAWLTQTGLVERFRREFGLETLALEAKS